MCGYLTYGNAVKSMIYESMSDGTVEINTHHQTTSSLGIIVALAIVINCVISVCLIINSTLIYFECTICKVSDPLDVSDAKSKMIRSAIIVGFAIIICVLPFFEELLDLIAAFGCVWTQIPLPILCYGKLFKSRPTSQKIYHVILLIFSAVSMSYGLTSAIYNLATKGAANVRAMIGLDPTPIFEPAGQAWYMPLNYQWLHG